MSQAAAIGNLFVNLSMNSAEFVNGVRSVQGSLSGLVSSLKAFAGAAALQQFGSLAVGAIKAVAEIGDVAETIGVTAEQLQVYQKMAIASGTSTDVLVRGLQTLAEQSVQSGSALEKLFTANGMTLAGKETNQIIREFMDLVKNARTPVEQLAIITEVLGDKVGRQLVESFRAGADGADEQYRRMEESGQIHLNAEVRRIQEIETKYNEVTDRIAVMWQGMVIDIVSGIDKMVERANAAAQSLPKVENGEIQTGRGRGVLAPINFPEGTANNKSANPRISGFGTMGGPNEFAAVPFKVTLRPPDKEETEKVKTEVAKTMSSIVPKIPPNTLEDVYGYGEAVNSLKERFAETSPEAGFFSDALQRISGTIEGGLSEAISGLITGTMSVKEAFASMAQSIIQTLSDLAAQMIASGLMKILLGAIGGGGGAGLNIGGMVFGGLYANGGYLGSGKWGIAGEAGPEIVHGPARITPMDKMGGNGGVNVTVINNTPAKVNTRQGADGGLTIEVVEEAVATAISRGGNKIDSAMQRGFGLRRAGR